MKPIIVYVDNEIDTITMTRERFEKLINEAYENGKSDASSTFQYIPYYPSNYPANYPSIMYGTDSTKPLDTTPIITCKSSAKTDAGGLADAMSRTAASANIAGVEMSELIGYLDVVGEVTQK